MSLLPKLEELLDTIKANEPETEDLPYALVTTSNQRNYFAFHFDPTEKIPTTAEAVQDDYVQEPTHFNTLHAALLMVGFRSFRVGSENVYEYGTAQ